MNNKFTITSGQMVISDPSYEIPTWCQGVVENVKNGVWIGEVDMVDDRVGALFAFNEEALISDSNLKGLVISDAEELPFDFGVDSGQLGYFDLPHYRNDDSAKDLKKYNFGENYDIDGDGEEWYLAICELTLSDEKFGVLPFGVVSSSGYGDGSYMSFGLQNEQGEYIAFMTTFINADVDFCSQ